MLRFSNNHTLTAPKFDLCDIRGNHFRTEVPRRAIQCPTLLNAIFAVSSRHLSIAGQFDQYASDRYHQECLKHLTTVPFDASALLKDDLLAATILLRTLEELDGECDFSRRPVV